MLERLLLKEKSSLHKSIDGFVKILEQHQRRYQKFNISIKRDYRTVFLCGANRINGTPSSRREALKAFIETVCKFKVIYAEVVFDELRRHSNNKNILSIEGEIAELADAVIIIVESPGAVCELGAFSNSELLHKIFVINDIKYKSSESFINAGPISLINNDDGADRVFWYNMTSDGVESVDSIGSIFPQVRKTLESLRSSKDIAKGVMYDIFSMRWSSRDRLTLLHLYFIHDIIFCCGPIEHNEIISILKFMYRNFDALNFDGVKYAVGVLRSLGLVQTFQDGNKYYNWSTGRETIIHYHGLDVRKITCVFRTHHWKYDKERLNVCLGKSNRG